MGGRLWRGNTGDACQSSGATPMESGVLDEAKNAITRIAAKAWTQAQLHAPESQQSAGMDAGACPAAPFRSINADDKLPAAVS